MTSVSSGGSTAGYGYEDYRLSTITHNGFSYTFGYDGYGNNTSVAVGGRTLTTNTFNLKAGLPTGSTYGNGDTVTYSYDNKERLVGKSFNGTPAVSYKYDAMGSLVETEDLLNNISFKTQYDLINRITGKAIFNPLLLGSIFVIIFLSVCKIPYADYKASAAPVNYLLLPATVALAIPLYEKWDLLRENAAAIIAGISVGTLVSLGSALALALALDLTKEQYATLLPKSVTTAISMDVAAELGGIAALTGAIVILTGIAGNLLAETVCKVFHITDPIAKGVGIGTSAHAVGTSKALQMGEVEGAMSGLSIAVAGVLTAVLCPVFVNLIH